MPTPTPGFRLAVRDLSPLGRLQFPSDRWTIATATAMPGFPASKLQGDLLADYWCAYNHRSSNTWISVASDNTTGVAVAQNIGVIAVLGANRRTPSAVIPGASLTPNSVRFRADAFPLADRIRPACTINSKTNLTGADANLTGHPIDPPDDPAPSGYLETKLAPTNSAVSTFILVTFANHYATERALAGAQTFRIHVRDVNNPTQIPSLTSVIYQSSSPVLTLTSPALEKVTAVSSSGGFIFTYSFPASSLASQTAALELHVAASTACDFIGIEMVLNLTGHLYDSGIETFSNLDLEMIAERLDLDLSTAPIVGGSGVTYFHVEFSDFCSYTTATYAKVGGGTASASSYASIVGPGDPDGRLRAGRFLAADAIIFPINGTGGYNLQLAADTSGTSSTSNRTRSGALRSPRTAIEWTEADLSIIRLSRVLQQRIERLVRVLGLSRNPTLLVPDPGMTEGNRDEQTMPRWIVIGSKTETHQGRMSGVDSDAGADGLNHSFDRWDVSMHLIEHAGRQSGG